MTRFVVDPLAVIELASAQIEVASTHELLAPTLLRSETLSLVHESVHRGEIPAAVGRGRLTLIGQIKIRYLGDAVLRRNAWDLAEKLGQPSTYKTEYLALTRLQGDALVALDAELAQLADNVVPVAGIDDLRR
jgi:predicted nucleic acid-binding protein